MKCYMTGRPCDYFCGTIENRKMFILSPFGFPYDVLYRKDGEIQQCLTMNKRLEIDEASRSDQAMRLGSIMCQSICKQIIEKECILADLSLPNPNVYYELGLAHALGKPALVCHNIEEKNPFIALFCKRFEGFDAFVRYAGLNDLREKIKKLERRHLLTLPSDRDDGQNPRDSGSSAFILVLENALACVNGLYEHLVRVAQREFEFGGELMASLTEHEKQSFQAERWRSLDVTTKTVGEEGDLDDLITAIQRCDICIVDTTTHPSQGAHSSNPNLYFCLGIAHGLGKDVIPLTNILASEIVPFDVRGLWHIFFSRHEELVEGLSQTVPRICVEHHKQLENAPYQKIWDCFLEEHRALSILYCGRAVEGVDLNYESRGARTNIDSWDTRAVSAASFALAQKYPASLIRTAIPLARTKVAGDEGQMPEAESQRGATHERLVEKLAGIHANSMIVGSPDNNDYAEVVLAKIYGIKPFVRRETVERKGAGFIFEKRNLRGEFRSAFYTKGEEDAVLFWEKGCRLPCTLEDSSDQNRSTYGVLTIAPNPLRAIGEGRMMVLSGFTGIATYGLLRVLVESKPDDEFDSEDARKRAGKFREQARHVLEELSDRFEESPANCLTALIKFDYILREEQHFYGDDRMLSGVGLMKSETHTPPQSSKTHGGNRSRAKANRIRNPATRPEEKSRKKTAPKKTARKKTG